MEKIIAWVKAHPIKTITTTATVLGSIITILTFGDQFGEAIDKYVVTDAELAAVRTEIVTEFRNEAVTLREIYIDSLTEQKVELEQKMFAAETHGETSYYKTKIESIITRIKKLRGDE